MATTYLTRTPSSASNRRTWTASLWVKRANLGSTQYLFAQGTENTWNVFNSANNFSFNIQDSIQEYTVTTSQVFRDTNSWYHLVCAVDTTQATASNRVKLYVNGEQVTDLSVTNYPPQNYETGINTTGTFVVGKLNYANVSYFDGSMTHFHFIDGTQYAASDFGETDATTGIWKPKTNPSVTYGTNGFFLKFENSGSMGTDSSGNANNFTVNGTMTQNIDTPSNVFATMNPLDNYYANSTFSNGNLSITTGSTEYAPNYSTIGVSQGKWYYECKLTADSYAGSGRIGVAGKLAVNNTSYLGSQTDQVSYGGSGVVTKSNASQSGTWASYVVNDIINVAVDLDNNFIYFGKNGTWQNSGDPTSGGSGTGGVSLTTASSTSLGVYLISASDNANNGSSGFDFNFGNGYFGTTAVSSAQNPDDGIGIFEYDVPAGYRALCTKSINAEEYS